MAVIVLALSAVSLFLPTAALWVQTAWINPLLMTVMFGMGLTLKTEDFRYVFRHPRNILIGCVSQFTIMPLLVSRWGKPFSWIPRCLRG